MNEMLTRGVPSAWIAVTVRTAVKAAEQAARGLTVREADCDRLGQIWTAHTAPVRIWSRVQPSRGVRRQPAGAGHQANKPLSKVRLRCDPDH